MSGLNQRQRLRAKTGCINCRSRRKKCDEKGPVCDRCALTGRSCQWPSYTELVDRRYASHPKSRYGITGGTKICIQSQQTAHERLTVDLEAIVSRHFSEQFYDLLLLPSCHPAFHDGWIKDIKELMVDDKSLRYAVLANAASHISIMDTNPDMESLALNYYSRAMKGLSGVLANANDPYLASCDGFLMSVMLLYLHGCMGQRTYADIPPHLQAAMRILTLRFFTSTVSIQRPFDRLALESVLYQIFLTSTGLWSDQSPLTDFDLEFWLRAETMLERSVIIPGGANSLNSPVLGVPVALFRLAIRAKNMYQHREEHSLCSLAELREELVDWEAIVLGNQDIDLPTVGDSASRQQSYCESASYLYVLIVSLLLGQTSERLSTDEQLPLPAPAHHDAWQIRKALDILQMLKNDDNWSGCYIGNWCVYTLGYLLSDPQDIQIVRNEMERRWKNTRFTQIARFHDDLEAVWAQRTKSQGSDSHHGLDSVSVYEDEQAPD